MTLDEFHPDTTWNPGEQASAVAALRSRVAQLEAALALARRDLAEANAALAAARHQGGTA